MRPISHHIGVRYGCKLGGDLRHKRARRGRYNGGGRRDADRSCALDRARLRGGTVKRAECIVEDFGVELRHEGVRERRRVVARPRPLNVSGNRALQSFLQSVVRASGVQCVQHE